MHRAWKFIAGGAVLSAVAVGIYFGVSARGGGDSTALSVKVERDTLTEKAQAVGEIQPRLRFQVKSKIPGIVRQCFVEVGDAVKEGDPLFEIAPDPTPMERTAVDRSVERAQSNYDSASAKLERFKALYPAGIVSKQDLDDTQQVYELARVALAEAREGRDLALKGRIEEGPSRVESVIRAPASGTVLTRAVNPGEPVVPLTSYQPGTELASIAEVSDLLFRGTVDEIDVGKLSLEMPVRIRIGALPKAAVTGKLTRIAPQSRVKDGATVFDVEVALDPLEKVTLRAGYSCNASIIIQEKKDALVLPERVITYGKERETATVEVPGPSSDAPPKKVEVKVGISDGIRAEVLSGLKEGDTVLERPPKKAS